MNVNKLGLSDKLNFGRLIVVICASIYVFVGCTTSRNTKDSNVSQFFEQSTRSDPSDEELKMFVYIKGCTAFRVKTKSQTEDYIFSSGNHCTNYDPVKWCQKASSGVYDHSKKIQLGSCERILIDQPTSDTFLFSVRPLKKAELDNVTPLVWGHLI